MPTRKQPQAKPRVVTTKTVATDYTLDAATGTLTEAANASFGAGNAIVVSYTSDFLVPASVMSKPEPSSSTSRAASGPRPGAFETFCEASRQRIHPARARCTRR